MEAYDNYIFDLYGTLVDIKTDEDQLAVWEGLADCYQQVGVCYDGPDLKAAYESLVEKVLLKATPQWDFPEFDVRQIFTQLYRARAGEETLSKEELDQWVDDLAANFRCLSRQHLTLYPSTKEVLEKLKSAGARLFLLSNAQAAYTLAEIDELGLRPYFEQVYLSSDYGIRKPQAEFLELVLKEHGLVLEDTVMVGNDLTSDMAVASKVGIDAILLNSFAYHQEELANFHGPVIADMMDLLGDDDDKH